MFIASIVTAIAALFPADVPAPAPAIACEINMAAFDLGHWVAPACSPDGFPVSFLHPTGAAEYAGSKFIFVPPATAETSGYFEVVAYV